MPRPASGEASGGTLVLFRINGRLGDLSCHESCGGFWAIATGELPEASQEPAI